MDKQNFKKAHDFVAMNKTVSWKCTWWHRDGHTQIVRVFQLTSPHLSLCLLLLLLLPSLSWLARLARLNPELQTDGRYSISHEFLQSRSFPLQHILCVPSANWLCRFFRIAVVCSRNHVICHPEEPSLRERSSTHRPNTWYLSLQHYFSCPRCFTYCFQSAPINMWKLGLQKVRRQGTHYSKLEAISTWCSSILSILKKKSAEKFLQQVRSKRLEKKKTWLWTCTCTMLWCLGVCAIMGFTTCHTQMEVCDLPLQW